MSMNKVVVNFFGGPGMGKTVAAADLFCKLKIAGIETNFVKEFAQECVIEGSSDALKDQVYVFGNTYHKLRCAAEHSTVAVTDSPILLSIIYQSELPDSFSNLVLDMHRTFNNINVLLDVRNESWTHSMEGRIHSHAESVSKDRQIKSMLDKFEEPYILQSDIEKNIPGFLIPHLTQQILEFCDAA